MTIANGGGVYPTQAAGWAGHSVDVLLLIYTPHTAAHRQGARDHVRLGISAGHSIRSGTKRVDLRRLLR